MISEITSHWRFLWLLAASLVAGFMNALAGGGSFLSFPAILGLGVPPIEANATNTVALWPGHLTSLFALHDDVRLSLLPVLLCTSIVGGFAGAEVLLHTPQLTFVHLIPWLILTGTMLFALSGPVSRWVSNRADRAAHTPPHAEPPINRVGLAVALLPICFYIGYFGAGGGIVIMAILAVFGMEDMHELNALKVVAAATSNLCAILTFIFSLISMLFAGAGGYLGARYTKRMNPAVLRAVVVITGIVIAAYFFWRQR
jgi:uncharacterized membrane protein YfcA